ncbi:MAG TPA: four helix bundle protein, partial [Vicinamibacterales bacterium]|nr:four helix bundle protein [Vicinamibacterales bacterium]
HRKLRVFHLADSLVCRIYKTINSFPLEERYGLQEQLRRAAVSVSAHIVEGSARRSQRDDSNFLNIAAGSAAEARYLCDVSGRLGFMPAGACAQLEDEYREVCGSLHALIVSIERLDPEP